jgi:hypothetical protein
MTGGTTGAILRKSGNWQGKYGRAGGPGIRSFPRDRCTGYLFYTAR